MPKFVEVARLWAVLMVFASPSAAHAHGGGLDDLGCHHNRKAGGYHCHRGALAGQRFESKADALTSSRNASPATPPSTIPLITGKPRIIDGDTIEIAGQRIRLHGIDAPESDQTCVVYNKRWRCGRNATMALSGMIGTNWVACRERDVDRYGRIVAVCNLAGPQGPDVNRMMVAAGWALAYRRFSTDYVEAETQAQRARKGVWRGDFIRPWDWRRGKRLSANDRQPGACVIKGNVGRGGTRIYHVPGGHYYPRTRIDPSKGERWFCTEAEARAAGWRRSRR